MSNTRTTDLEAARTERIRALADLSAATTRTAKREAAERAEFWGSRAAMLQVEKGWAL